MTKDEFLANSRGIIAAIYKKYEAERVTTAPLIWEQRDQQTQTETEQINIQQFSDNLPSLAQGIWRKGPDFLERGSKQGKS